MKFFKLSGLLCVFSGIYSAVNHRPRFNDGALWYFNILHTNSFFKDAHHARISDLFLQIPAVLALKIFPADLALKVASFSLDYMYALHPFICLALVYFILKHYGRVSYFIFPAMSFIWATGVTSSFAVGVVPFSLTLFWPLFYIILLRPSELKMSGVIAGLLLIALSLSHEISFVFLIGISALLFMRYRESRHFSHLILLVVSALGLVFILFKLRSPATQESIPTFWETLAHRPQGYLLFAAASLVVFLIFPFFKRERNLQKRSSFKTIVISGSEVFFIFLIWMWLAPESFSIWESYESRIYAIPLASVIAIIAWGFHREKIISPTKDDRLRTFMSVGPFLILIWVIYDFNQTILWSRGEGVIQSAVDSEVGCLEIRQGNFQNLLRYWGHSKLFIPYEAVLLHPTHRIHTVLFYQNVLAEYDPCQKRTDGIGFKNEEAQYGGIKFTPGRFQFEIK